MAKLKICSICNKPSKLWYAKPPIGICCHNTYAAKQAIERHRGEFEHKGLVQTSDGETAKPFKVYMTADIKKVSTRQQKLNAAYKVIRDAFMKNKKYCEARLKGCTGKATECHHKAGRGEHLLDDSKYLALCHNCHQFITDNSAFAIENNFSESRLSKAI